MRKSGFSLVELSIVLVILGLLVGGILAGKTLIRASELRAVSTEYQGYVTAMHSFRDKYFALPGDITNATSIWGTATTCPGDNTTPSTTAATCNGDGDGFIRRNIAPNSNEVFRLWQQLANAGLIEGSYSGVTNTVPGTQVDSLAGFNAPGSKMRDAAWTVYSAGVTSYDVTDTSLFEGDYGRNPIYFGGTNGGTSLPSIAVLKPAEAWNIDTKMDDGKPATGLVRTRESSGGTNRCSDLAASAVASRIDSVYLIANDTIFCSFVIKTGL